MRKLGILGGMGPLAGCEFYRMIIMKTPASCDQDHIDVVLSGHATIPDRTKVVESGDPTAFLRAIYSDIQLFEAADVDLIAIPCNTSHTYYRHISDMTAIPVFNMVKYALHRINSDRPHTSVTVCATEGTLRSDVYGQYGRQMGVDVRYPAARDAERIMRGIYTIKSTQRTRLPELDDLFAKYAEEGTTVLLACTELSLLQLPNQLESCTVDAMALMADESVRLMYASERDFGHAAAFFKT